MRECEGFGDWADDAEKSKPEPDIFHSAMRLLGNPAHDAVLVVGDTPYDARAATKAKLPIIGVLCGGFSREVLKASGCKVIYEDPADLLKNLERVLKDSKNNRCIAKPSFRAMIC